MGVFEIRRMVTNDGRAAMSGFVAVRYPGISRLVVKRLAAGAQGWNLA